MNKIKNIEFLRIIFVLAIMWMHYLTDIGKYVSTDMIDFLITHSRGGGKAVEAFFIISGFLLVLTFKHSTTVIQFIQKKIVRLVPVIVFALLITYILSWFCITKFSLPAAIINMTFTDKIVGHCLLKANAMNHTWYISALFWVLLLYFYVIKYFSKHVTNLFIGLCTILSYSIVFNLNNGALSNPGHTDFILNYGILRALGGIGIGYFIGEWYKENAETFKNEVLSLKTRITYTILELTFLFICVAKLFITKELKHYNSIILMSIVVLIILFIQKKGYISRLFDNDWCVKIGKYSYSIYVLHILPVTVMIHFGLIQKLGIYSVIPMFIGSVILAILGYHMVEKPCINKFSCYINQGENSK